MADGIGQALSGLGEVLKNEVKTVAKTAGGQLGVATVKPKQNASTQQAINTLGAKDQSTVSPQLERDRAELKQIAFQNAQSLGVKRQDVAQQPEPEQEIKSSAKTPPALNISSMGRNNIVVERSQRKIEDKAGRLG